jgi:hypothetical protein
VAALWRTVKREWDRLLTYLCILLFGVSSLVQPVLSVEKVLTTTEWVFNVEMLISGVLLTVGVFYPALVVRRLGHLVAFLGFGLIAFLILLNSGVRGVPYTILAGVLVAYQVVEFRRAPYVRLSRREVQELQEMVSLVSERVEESGDA